MFFVQLFYGILLVSIGFAIIKYRKDIKGWTGNFVWAEKYIGNGGTYLVLIVTGMFLIFLGVWYPFGGAEKLNERPGTGMEEGSWNQ